MSVSSFRYSVNPIVSFSSPSLVQHVAGGASTTGHALSSTGDNYVYTLPNPVGAGNCLICSISYAHGATPTVSDNNGNSWPASPAVTADAGSGNMVAAIYVLPNANSGITSVKVTFGSSQTYFHMNLTEFYNISLANPVNGTSSAAGITGSSLSSGSFIPGNNDANGGNLILSYFPCATGQATSNPTSWVPGGSFILLDADIGWVDDSGLPKASQYFVQTTHSSINPSITCTGDTTDIFNCVSVALKVSSAGTAPSSIPRIIRILHFTTTAFPTTYKLQCPCTGNLRFITGPDPNTNISSVTDSESNTWTGISALNGNSVGNFYYLPNSGSNTNLSVTLHSGGGDPAQSYRFFDITGAATSNVVDTTALVNVVTSSGTFNDGPTISPSSSTGGIMIASVGLGTGPGLGMASGAPSGSIFDLVTYTGETDFDTMDNADLSGHANYPSGGGTYNWNWLITNNGTEASGGAVAFKAI